MFAKLAAVIVAVGATAGALLCLRQQRLQAVNELAMVQRRVAEHDRTLWHLRLEIAALTTPERTERMAQALGPLEPLRPWGQTGPARVELAGDPARAVEREGALR